MLLLIRSAVATTLLLAMVSPADAQPVRRSQPNVAGVELLGRALIYSVNYERYVKERLGIGVGIAVWDSTGEGSSAAVVPLYVSLNPIGETHSLYIATGVTVGAVEDDTSARAFGTATVGYQYRSRSGFIIRPALNLLLGSDPSFVWPGITLAKSF